MRQLALMIDWDPSSIFDLTTVELVSIRQRLDLHVAPAAYVRVLEQELREREVSLMDPSCARHIAVRTDVRGCRSPKTYSTHSRAVHERQMGTTGTKARPGTCPTSIRPSRGLQIVGKRRRRTCALQLPGAIGPSVVPLQQHCSKLLA